MCYCVDAIHPLLIIRLASVTEKVLIITNTYTSNSINQLTSTNGIKATVSNVSNAMLSDVSDMTSNIFGDVTHVTIQYNAMCTSPPWYVLELPYI